MTHKVTFSVPERPLANVDVEFNIRKNGTMFGTLKISQGGIVWRASPASFFHHFPLFFSSLCRYYGAFWREAFNDYVKKLLQLSA